MKDLQILEHKEQRVLTTQQLAAIFETDVNSIQQNFKRNKSRFIEGKHYYILKGADLKAFKNLLTNSQQVDKHTSQLILWTERGANFHSKILDTDRAWEQFEIIEDTYFRVKHQPVPQLPTTPMEIMEVMFHALKNTNADVQYLDERLNEVEETQALSWRDLMMRQVYDYCDDQGLCISPFLGKLYREVEQITGRSLNKTLIIRKNKMKKQGVAFKKIKQFHKIDVIEQDKPLRKVFEEVLHRYIK